MNRSKVDLARIKRYLEEHELDAITSMNPITSAYLANFKRFDHYTFQNNLYTHFPVFPRRGDPWWVGGKLARYLPETMRPAWIKEFYDNDSSVFEDNIEHLIELLHKKGFANARIGLDFDGVTVKAMRILEASLPNAEFVDASVFFKQLKAVKIPREIKILQAALDALEKGYRRLLQEVRAGRSMQEVVAIYGQVVREHGTQDMSGNWATRAWEWYEEDSLPDDHSVFSRESIIQPGALTRVNTLGYRSGYWSDNGIMFSVGEPASDVREAAELQWRAMEIVSQEILPGMSAQEAYQACCEAIDREAGYTGAWDCHSIGLDVMEDPWIGIGNERRESPEIRFEPNTVICIETGSGAEQTFVMGKEKLHRMSTMRQQLHIV